jgi:hypothetical protein
MTEVESLREGLNRIIEFTNDILTIEPSDTEVSGQINQWARIAVSKADKAIYVEKPTP